MLKMGYSHKEVLTKDQSDKKVKGGREEGGNKNECIKKTRKYKKREKANKNNNIIFVL